MYDEALAPEKPSRQTMGNSLKYVSQPADGPQPFEALPWAFKFLWAPLVDVLRGPASTYYGSGALGGRDPRVDLLVSSRHNVLLKGSFAKALFNETEVLVAELGANRPGEIADLVHRLGFVQVDSINTVARAGGG